MTMPRQRVTLITLGVSDMAQARSFYEGWGLAPHQRSMDGLALYQMQGPRWPCLHWTRWRPIRGGRRGNSAQVR